MVNFAKCLDFRFIRDSMIDINFLSREKKTLLIKQRDFKRFLACETSLEIMVFGIKTLINVQERDSKMQRA